MFARTCTRMMGGVLIPIVGVLFISACQPAVSTLRAPNKNELETFVQDHRITPIADKLLDGSLVLLYENSASFGYYALTVREPEGVLVTGSASAAKSDQPILTLGRLTGERPFIAVIVQDATLSAKTSAIEVAIDSQTRLTATTGGKAGAILVSPSAVKDWRTVTLYDAQGQAVFRQGGNVLQQVRVTNGGNQDLKGLALLFPGATAVAEATRVEFGDVLAGRTTEYRSAPNGVYRYAAYEYRLDHRVVTQPVTDWIGENPMPGEKFTYRITLDPNKEPGNQIQLLEVLVDQP